MHEQKARSEYVHMFVCVL